MSIYSIQDRWQLIISRCRSLSLWAGVLFTRCKQSVLAHVIYQVNGRTKLAEKPQQGRRNISAEIRGKELYIPNLNTLLSPLASASTPQFEILATRINYRLDEIIKDPVVRQKVDKVNLPLFIARWYPYSTLESQEAMALYNLWLFVWDDVFDGEDDVETRPLNMTDMFARTIEYVSYHLGLSGPSTKEPEAPTAATSLFKYAGELLREHTDLKQRQRFFQEVKFYINKCAEEQKVLDTGFLPSVKEYWHYRWGTSSVYTGCALAEYMAGVRLPESLLETRELRSLWTEVNRNVVIVNDVLSLKKEIHGSLHSLIPIVMQDTGKDLQASVNDIVGQLQQSIIRFDQLSTVLLSMVEDNFEVKEQLIKYIELLQFNLTGNYSWSVECGRYKVMDDLQEDGSLLICL